MSHPEHDIRKRAKAHLAARWKNVIVPNGWQGSVSRRVYIRANLSHAVRNIKNGMRPDGRGNYLRKDA